MNQGGSCRGRLFIGVIRTHNIQNPISANECLYRPMGPEMVKSRPNGHPKLYICATSSTVGMSFSAYRYPRSFRNMG